MNTEEARRLAIRIINTWHSGPHIDEWTAELATMDAGTAGTTFARLRRDLEHAPSIARFWREYRTLNTTTPNTEPPCEHCDNTGWITTTPLIRMVHDQPHDYRQATACPYCDPGAQAARIQADIHNAATWRHPSAHADAPLPGADR